MGFTRSPLLKPETEKQLKKDMLPLWTSGKEADTIATTLHFGEPTIINQDGKKEENPYAKLKKFHVWLYRTKFNKKDKHDPSWKSNQFPPRKKGSGYEHRYKHKQSKVMEFSEFQKHLNANCSKDNLPDDPGYVFYVLRKRAYLIASYWTPLRKSELIERIRKDFKIDDDNENLIINLQRKKKFYRTTEPEPAYIPLNAPMMNELLEFLNRFKPNEHPFDFSGVTAWTYVKDVLGEDFYPHYGRYNFITKAVRKSTNPGELVDELLQDTGLDVQTIVSYIMDDPQNKGRITRREINKLKEEGIMENV